MMKRIISSIISFSLLLSIVIIPTFAAETVNTEDLNAAIVNTEVGDAEIGEIGDTEDAEASEAGAVETIDTDSSLFNEDSEEEIELKITDFPDYVACPTIDLPVRDSTGEGEFNIIDDAPVSQNLDFSNAIDLTAELDESGILPANAPENQAPVADPYVFVGNPDSMRDGKYTTEN